MSKTHVASCYDSSFLTVIPLGLAIIPPKLIGLAVLIVLDLESARETEIGVTGVETAMIRTTGENDETGPGRGLIVKETTTETATGTEGANVMVSVSVATENVVTATETVNVKTTTTGRRDADARMTSLRMSAARESEAMTDQILYYQNRQHLLACLLPLYP